MNRKLLTIAAALMVGGLHADTCIIVGKNASSDGCVHIGRSVDSAKDFPARCRLQAKPRIENKSGRRHWGSDGFVWHFPPTTCGYIASSRMTSDKVGLDASMAANDRGLAIVALRTDAPQPEAKESISAISSGASEREYPLVLAQCATNATTAVALVRSILGSCGSGRANIIVVADRNEAWIVETHPGRACETMKVPDDAFITFGDSFTLKNFKPQAASRQYGVKDVFGLLRSRDGGKHPSICHVLSVATNQPLARAVTAWTSFGDAKAAPFIPVSNAAPSFDEKFTTDDKTGSNRAKFGDTQPCDVFQRLQALVASDPQLLGAGVRNYWELREDELIDAWQKQLARGNPKSLADFTNRELARAMKDAARLSEEVIFAMARQTPYEASDFDRIALNQMCREGVVRYPVKLESGEADFSGTPKWLPKMDEWKDPTLVAWGKPAATGKKRLLVCVASADTFAVQHLKNRLDVECDIIECGYWSNNDDQGWMAALKRVEHSLAQRGYDGYVFIGAGPHKWPLKLQRKLIEEQLAGKGLALVNAGGWYGRQTSDPDFVRGAPRKFEVLVPDTRPGALEFDVVATNLSLPTITRSAMGIGRTVYLGLPRTERTTYMTNPHFSSSWTMTPDRVFQDEYCYAYSCRAVMDAIGMRGPAKVLEIRREAITFTNDTTFAGTATVTVRDCWGKPVWTKDLPVQLGAGETKLPLELPKLTAGYYGLDVILKSAKGACDYACELFTVRSAAGQPAIASAKLAKEIFLPTEEVLGEVRVENPTDDLKILGEVRDPRQRLIAKAEWEVDEKTGVAKIVLKQDRLRLNCHFIHLTLVDDDDQALDTSKVWFFRKIGDGERTDFRLYDYAGSHGGKDCAPRLAALDYNGMDILGGGNAQRLFYGNDPSVRERIPGKQSIWNSSLSSPMWTNWLVKTYTRHAKSLASRNGRMLSLGDDSNGMWELFEGTPDWVEPYFAELKKCFDAERKAAAEAKVKGFRTETPYVNWLKKRGLEDVIKPSYDMYWGFRNPLVNKIGYQKLAAAMIEDDVPLMREAARQGYGDVRVFNAANRVKAQSIDTLDLATIKKMNPYSKPQFPWFLKWLAEKYGTVQALNKAWGTKFADIWTIDQEAFDKLSREKNIRANIDCNRYKGIAFQANCRLIGETALAVDPSIAAGYGASWCGHELQEQFDTFRLCAPYANCCIAHTNRRLRKPGTYMGVCIGWYGWPIGWVDAEKVSHDRRVKEGWDALLGGANFVWMWTACYGLNGARSTPPSGYGWLFDTLGAINRGPAALVNRGKRDDYGVAVLMSNDTCPLECMPNHGSQLMGCLGWNSHFEVSGFGAEYITPRDLRTGELQRRGTKLLVMPNISYIDEAAAKAVVEFVAKGGMVVANRLPGEYDPEGIKLPKNAFGDLFKDNPRALIVADKEARAKVPEIMKKLGVHPKVRFFDEKGKPVQMGSARFLRDGGEYLFSARRNTGDKGKGAEFLVELDQPGVVYDIVDNKRILPNADGRYPISLKALDSRVYYWQPYVSEKLEVEFDGKPKRGGTLHLEAKLVTSPVAGAPKTEDPGTRVFRVEFVPPGGLKRTELAVIPRYLANAPKGELKLDVPLAFDERGDLTVEVTDVASGVTARLPLAFD